MIDLDQLQEELDFLERDGLGIIELFTNVVYSMLCELKAAREVIKQVEGALSFNSEDGYNIGKAMDKYYEARRG